jgi:chromosome segregation protein
VDAVIVERVEGADASLEILEKGSARGALLPLEVLTSPRSFKIELEKAPGGPEAVMGVATGLIEAAAELRPILDLLLGQVVVVRDKETARRILAGGDWRSWPNFRVVTLRGELFYASGPVLAGATGQGVLSRPRQRREMQDNLEQVVSGIETLNETLAHLDNALQNKRREEIELRQHLEQVRSRACDQGRS